MTEYDKMTKAELIEELRRKEKLFSSSFQLVSSSDDAIIGKSLDGTIFSWNTGAENIYGYSAQEIIGQNITILSPPDRHDEVLRILEKIKRGERVEQFETVRVTKEGRQIHVSLSISPIIDTAGEIIGASTIARDVTERKRAEEELLRANAYNRSLIEASLDPLVTIGSDGRITDVNAATEEVTGCRREELIGTDFCDYFTDPEAARSGYQQVFKDGFVRDYPLEIRHRDGHTTPVLYNATVYRDEAGNTIGVFAVAMDITERMRVEKELRQSERRKTILNQIANVFLTVPDEEMYGDVLAVVLGATESKFGFFGFIADNGDLVIPSMNREIWHKCQVPDKSVIFSPDIWGDSLWGKAIRQQKSFYSDGPFHIPEGHLHIDHFLATPIVFGNKTIGLLSVADCEPGYTEEDKDLLESIANNISPILNARLQRDRQEQDRKRAEETLRESELRYREVFENTSECIFLLDVSTDGRFKFAGLNPAEEKAVGFSNAELSGKFIEEALPAELAYHVIAYYRRCVEAGTIINYDQELDLPVGRRYFHTVLIPVRNVVGDIYRIVGVARDITERKQMEEELRRAHNELEKRVLERTEQLEKTAEALRTSEERHALAVQGANDVIWDWNIATGEAYHSSRYKSMLGYEDNEMANNVNVKEWQERIHPDDYQRVMEAINSYLEGRIPVFKVEYRLRHKDGSHLWVVSRGACLRDSQGRPYRMAGSLTDITEHRKLEQQLLQSHKMESIGLLAGGVAHEFNNLLTAISGYGQILQESIPADDELSQESIGNVLKAAELAAELTRGLLAFSRKQLIDTKPLHIDTLISNAGKFIQRIIGEDIEFSVNFSGKNLLTKADTGQIEQVLMNLATNARDAMPRGGRLSVTTRQVVVKEGFEAQHDLPAPGRYALISVADTGMGIDKKSLESIFEPFYTTKEVGKGTGLGLSIVYGIIKQHNGSILVSSEPGKGTTFNIYLPLVKGHAVKDESRISAPLVSGMETLLVAEDEEIVRMFMKKILERAGYKVIVADNGEGAVARFKEHDDISLVLSDVVMPRKNGKDMLDEIRKIKPGVKAVFISGYAADIMSKKGMVEEGTEFITKPFKKNDLLQKVREVLDRE